MQRLLCLSLVHPLSTRITNIVVLASTANNIIVVVTAVVFPFPLVLVLVLFIIDDKPNRRGFWRLYYPILYPC